MVRVPVGMAVFMSCETLLKNWSTLRRGRLYLRRRQSRREHWCPTRRYRSERRHQTRRVSSCPGHRCFPRGGVEVGALETQQLLGKHDLRPEVMRYPRKVTAAKVIDARLCRSRPAGGTWHPASQRSRRLVAPVLLVVRLVWLNRPAPRVRPALWRRRSSHEELGPFPLHARPVPAAVAPSGSDRPGPAHS